MDFDLAFPPFSDESALIIVSWIFVLEDCNHSVEIFMWVIVVAFLSQFCMLLIKSI